MPGQARGERGWRLRTGIQGRLAWLFGAFLLLVVISVLVTYWGLETEKQDARLINLAGRQRMLVQQIARQSWEFEQDGEDHERNEVGAAVDSFGRTLEALQAGGTLTDYTGETLVLPRADDLAVQRELAALLATWKSFQSQVDRLLATRSGAPAIAAAAPGLIDRADAVVRAYEAASLHKIDRLHTYQLGFLAAGLLLSSLGWRAANASLVRPIRQIEDAARRIGAGDLHSPVVVRGPAELEQLGEEFDRTRAQLQSSRAELQTWVDTLEKRVWLRTAELEALATVSHEITSHLGIGEVLESVTAKAQHLLGSEVAELCLLEEGGRQLTLHASVGVERSLRSTTSPVEEGAAATLLQGHGARACDAGSCPGFCEILVPAYRASHLAVPLRLNERVIGVLCAGSSHPGAFRPDAPALLTQLAGAATVALENSRLYEQAENGATLLERQRIASEMHDGLLQTLSFLRLMAQMTGDQLAAGNVEDARVTLRQIERANAQAESEIRRAITSLQEDFPVQLTLQQQLAQIAEEAGGSGPAVRFLNSLRAPLVLDRQDGEQVLRLVREALSNARRHSGAQLVTLSLIRVDSDLVLHVEDDGMGFDPSVEPPGDRPHFGIKIMCARASRLGGDVVVDSAPGRGTRGDAPVAGRRYRRGGKQWLRRSHASVCCWSTITRCFARACA